MADIQPKTIVGYLDPLTARPGDEVTVMVSADIPGEFTASLVKLISGDSRRRGTGYREIPVDSSFAGRYPCRHQPVIPGSYARLGDLPLMPAFSFRCFFYPTTPAGQGTLMKGPGVTITHENHRLSIQAGETRLQLDLALAANRWCELSFSISESNLEATLTRYGQGVAESGSRQHTASISLTGYQAAAGTWWLATRNPEAGGHFNGRVEAPEFKTAGNEVIARWGLTHDLTSETFIDDQGQFEGTFYQQPTRAVKGFLWDGTCQKWSDNPAHYAAVHFHDDDLVDAGWQADFSFQVPDIASGVYGVKVTTANNEEDVMPLFVVRPLQQQATTEKRLAYLVPTATYLAYANQRLGIGDGLFGRGPRNPSDAYLARHPEVGGSLYEHHSDGSGVHFSSRRRPVLNMKPHNTPWGFTADTNICAWLDAIGQDYDIITDEQLHFEGPRVLAPYRTIMTGTHPEYYSTDMLDNLSDWLDVGGRLMYMGGNGFYWRIAYAPDNPAMIEVRRAEDGTRAWIAEPGEYYHQWTGEYGGLWRRLGRPPNHLVGVGFTAQGFDGGTYYRVLPEASDPRISFALEGIATDEFFGNHGTQAGGAAGEEIDRFDIKLGSPAHAIVIASSEDHKPGMLTTKEEFLMTDPNPRGHTMHADMTFFETPSGGAVFSTGSISYAGSLSTNNYDNDVARLTGNVLKRFMEPHPFDFPLE